MSPDGEDTRPPKPEPLPVDPDGVAEAMKTRDHWILWRYEWRCQDDEHESEYCGRVDCADGEWSKAPRRPNGAYARSNDKTTWSAFETVIDAYDTGDFDGIGYVFAGDLVGFDFDDCRDPDDPDNSIPDVVGETIAELDSYTERSPSGTGFHTIVIGSLPDGYDGNRADLPCEPVRDEWGTPHIEVYDESSSRYFTVTGKHVEKSPDDAQERDDEVDEIHGERIADGGTVDADADGNETDGETGENENGNGNHGGDGVDLDDEELLAEAMNAPNGDKFRRLWTGDTSMHNDDHSRADQALCTQLAFWTGGDRERIDSLFRDSDLYRDKWDEDRGDQTYGERTIDKALEEQTEYYGSSSGRPTRAGAIHEREDGYYRRDGEDEDGNPRYRQISNFVIDVESRLLYEKTDDREWHLTVIPASEPDYEVTVATDVFNEIRQFKNEVVTGFGTWFKGSKHDLADIRELIAAQDAPTRTAVTTIGIHGSADDGTREFVTPSGSFDADGWLADPNYVFTGEGNNTTRQWQLTADKHPTDEIDVDAVADILRLLPQIRQSERFIPALAWFYAAPFRPFVHELTGQFNNLHVMGESEAGKSSTLELLWQLFGLSDEMGEANGKKFGLEMAMSKTNAVPIVLDEYKPSEWPDYKVDSLHDLLRKITRGGTVEKGRPDLSTVSFDLTAPTCVAGEQPITGPAESRRAIMTAFTEHARHTDDHARAFHKLTGSSYDGTLYDGYELTHHALAYYQWVLEQDPTDLADVWREYQALVEERVDELGLEGVKDDTKKGYTTVLFGARMYRRFAAAVCGVSPVEHGVTDDAALEAIDYLTGEGSGAEGKSHTETLLDVMGRAIDAEYLVDGQHYTVVNQDTTDAALRVRLRTAFDKIKQYARDHDAGDELFDSRSDYESRLRDAVDDDTSPILDTSVLTHFDDGQRRAVSIDPDAVVCASTAGERDDADATEGSGSDRSLNDLTPGWDTFTATVSTCLEPANWEWGKGVLVDDTGATLNYVVEKPETPEAHEQPRLLESVTYRFERVSLETNSDDVLEARIKPGATSVKSLREPRADVDQTGLADGGNSQAARREALFTEIETADDGIAFSVLAGRLDGRDPTELRNEIDRLAEQGKVVTRKEDGTTIVDR